MIVRVEITPDPFTVAFNLFVLARFERGKWGKEQRETGKENNKKEPEKKTSVVVTFQLVGATLFYPGTILGRWMGCGIWYAPIPADRRRVPRQDRISLRLPRVR